MKTFGIHNNVRVLATRIDESGLPIRRYETEHGTTFRTVEIPTEVWRAWSRSARFKPRLEMWQRSQARDQLFMRARKLHSEGWKIIAIAHELGVPERTVRDWTQLTVRRKKMVIRGA